MCDNMLWYMMLWQRPSDANDYVLCNAIPGLMLP